MMPKEGIDLKQMTMRINTRLSACFLLSEKMPVKLGIFSLCNFMKKFGKLIYTHTTDFHKLNLNFTHKLVQYTEFYQDLLS